MKIVIVEDNKQLLRTIRALLEGETGVVVAGAFASAEATLEALPLLCADIRLKAKYNTSIIS
jgi:CheY-like chemotaxis protein